MPPATSPHGYALKPSEARALQNAEVVFWVGEALTPDLGRKIGSIAGDSRVVTLGEAPGTGHLPSREAAVFGAQEAPHGHHDHEDHDDHGHAEEEHAHEEDAHAGHAHGPDDPHLWLSPDNAAAWLDHIATVLAETDPENAETYAANAEAARATLESTVAQARETLAPHHEDRYIVFHDAYQYLEASFELQVVGAIQVSAATPPSPGRLAELREAAAEAGVTCIFAEPQFDPRLVATVSQGTELPVAELDPLGATLTTGAGFYPELISELAGRIADCAAD
ncbi:Zinc ABC transporter, periplasmic-binding protein ZnuA [Salipiger mucosus DSM 16094]|uniref:High-affinity zinc uptake system protein ZnuA n=1 Tax=Salipiger mucosus DSM 16094 TaxID=1123237 RepID=S9QQU7_9RHOB|nr:Zinc ABC transporter, periplasmic-binding protein ZnuA [Salipiger mucosus DSM 16094]